MSADRSGTWAPLTPDEIRVVFEGASFPWWIAGGFGIELALQRSLRSHADIDVFVLRRDMPRVGAHLSGWECWAADPPGQLRPWTATLPLGSNVHDMWCRRPASSDWHFQLMIDESEGTDWVSRRHPSIRLALTDLTCHTEGGLPYLAPEVSLFYKANDPRDKDRIDFDAIHPSLSPTARRWLRQSIRTAYGTGHPWPSLLLDTD